MQSISEHRREGVRERGRRGRGEEGRGEERGGGEREKQSFIINDMNIFIFCIL